MYSPIYPILAVSKCFKTEMASSSNPEIHIRSIRQNIVAICPHFCRFHANFSCSMSPFEGKRSPGHGWDLLQWFTWARHNSMESCRSRNRVCLATQWWFEMADKSLFLHEKTMCNLDFIISPFQFFVGNYTLSRNYPHSWGYGFLKMRKLKKNIKCLNSDFEWGLCKPNFG